ncbi:receptor-like serine/threonine-protein kinase ALE2 isoform X4 [Lycium ferocissimum]|uniref:receptor-like serine/threonine-protein kinase ALE2 isoform X4 n=1 Tax=Lycium ferocissimum TaxID=112874 RepID=UPI00281667C2|nr:receptor-like serine/threonine-protein kinase ALE2 isoform X4 [Lycium ferocissimum]
MGGVKLHLLCLVVLELCAFAFSQGSKGFSLSPSPSASTAIPPIEEGIPSSVSHGNALRSNAPAPAFELNGTSPPANVFPPPKEVLTPSQQPSAPIILPTPSSAPPAITSAPPQIASLPAPPPTVITWNVPAPVLPPSAPKADHRHTEQPVVVPEAPAPVSSPGRKSPDDAPTKAPQVPGSTPPSESRPSESPLSSNGPAPRENPQNSLPTLPRSPDISPSIPPVLNAPAPREKPQNPLPTLPRNLDISPSIPPVLNAPAPREKPQNPLPTLPRNPEISPSTPPVLNAPAPREKPQNPLPTLPRIPDISPSTPPVLNAPAPRGKPQNHLPTHPIIPEVSPSIPPVFNAPSPRGKPQDPLPARPTNPEVSPSIPPATVAPPPRKLPNNSLPSHPRFPRKPPSVSPVKHDITPVSTPWPSINHKRASAPTVAPPNRMTNRHPAKAPTEHKAMGRSTNAPPHKFPNSPPEEGSYPPLSAPSTSFQRDHHLKDNMTAITPSPYEVYPPVSTEQGPLIPPSPSFHSKSYPKTNLRPHSHSPGTSVSPLLAPLTSPESHDSPAISESPTASSRPTKKPFVSPKMSPSGSPPRHPKIPRPFQALPPPPPNQDCASLTCAEPFTNGPPKAPCVCVLPMRVGLRLSVALYTFFPLVSELATEIAVGVFMDPSQVRIMGANSASQYPEKTIVLIDLVPLGEKFDNTTAFLTSQRFWHKQVVIKASLFGDYDVLYVQYPGLPPSPPSAASDIDTIGSQPYPGDNNGSTKPLGVDVSGKQHKNGPNRSVIAVIVLSASVAVILGCAVAWVLLFRHRDRGYQSEPTPLTTLPSLAKSSGIATSIIGSRPNSPSLSFSSSFAAYTGSARTFSSNEIERATDRFNEARVLGEGGFGVVYSGVLDDGMEVAVKVLKRDDQQGGREFLAEVEMLSRLHHRNLVKLIGICLEERSRCLLYELIPNGSVESHLHGIDKEISPLDWNARIKIALGAARGLAYLHEDSSPRVIHRDFKSSNILLEHDFTPKVSDFGLARAALEEGSRHISTRVMGTFGYVAPEYAMTGHLLVKSDVYSYGVVLLELLTGRKPVDMSQPPGQENLVAWARPLLTSEEGLELIVDRTLGPDFPFDDIVKVAAIASMCVQPEVSHRPFMGEVVQALKLVCNECEQTKGIMSRSCSRDDLSIDMDGRISTSSSQVLNTRRPQSPGSNSDSELDVERGLSMSDLLSPLASYGKQESGSFRRYSSSGPIRKGKTRRLWHKMRRLSGGSVSEHGVMLGLRPGSH